jgi:hypothetical protein
MQRIASSRLQILLTHVKNYLLWADIDWLANPKEIAMRRIILRIESLCNSAIPSPSG